MQPYLLVPLTSVGFPHWAWQPLQEIEGPSTRSVDSFIEEKLKKTVCIFRQRPGRHTLIRRLTHDLHGLPPTPEAVDTFLADKNPKAYDELVDHLLGHPRFGERIAQHWLDLAHYADTHGFERDKRRPNAWRYRDTSSNLSTRTSPTFASLRSRLLRMSSGRTTGCQCRHRFFGCRTLGFRRTGGNQSPVLRRSARALSTWTTWQHRSSLRLKPLPLTVPVVTITSSIPFPRRNILG